MKRTLLALALALAAVLPAAAQRPPQEVRPSPGLPEPLQAVGIDQRLDETVPLDLPFRDEQGREVRLGDYFGERPVILVPAYYSCPMLCGQVLNGLASGLSVLSFDAGEQFEVVTFSFDPRDTAEAGAARKAATVQRYGRDDGGRGWHFLTADEKSIRALTEAIGFRYTWDDEIGQYAHATGLIVLTPSGRLARYFYGIEPAPRDLRLALVESADEKIGNAVDALLLYCYQYDPATGRYGAVVMRMLRIAGALTVGGIVALILLLRRRAPAREDAVGGAA